jgi:aerobic carbon-monoxide dehydrogenase large subunit
MKFALGQAVPRAEDPRLLTGRGRYTDDFVLPRLAHAYLLRSPDAHARTSSIDVGAAQQMPGIFAVPTGGRHFRSRASVPRTWRPKVGNEGF